MRPRKWAWLGILLTAASCVQILDGDHPYTNDPPPDNVTPCVNDANCDDQNSCTVDTCLAEGVCGWSAVPDGLAAVQVPGDCKRDDCVDGVVISTHDDADVQDDNQSCTNDSCVNGQAMHVAVADDTMCIVGASTGSCQGGVCMVQCDAQNPCNDNNPCTEDLCNASTGMCTFGPLDGIPTPGADQPAGDCKFSICDNGVDTALNDDADVPDDGNPCTLDVCTAGVPSNPPQDAGIPCTPGDSKVCDGNSACVDCTTASHCVDIIEDECTKRSCMNNTCVPVYSDSSTLASPSLQIPGNCKKVVCNGMGGTTIVNDNTDLPVDSNLCTKDVCTNGVPSNPQEAQGTACGNGLVCDATGSCNGCTMASQCPGTDDFCKTRTCTNNQCGFSFTPSGTDLPMGQTTGDCKVLECDGMGNTITSVLTSDVPIDGNPCTLNLCSAQGVPSNPPSPINTACNVGGNTACDGLGNCKKSLGTTCSSGSECASTYCADGVCCNNSCTAVCRSCNQAGNLGTCSDVPKGTDDGTCTGTTVSCNTGADCDDENGVACSGSASCLSGFCVDGFCCNSACNTACKSCNLIGSVGTCGNIASGEQDNNPTNICTGMNLCDGNGVCKKVNGAPCAAATECSSGFCADGVCCNGSCQMTCKSCDVAGSVGTCSNIPFGQQDNSPANICAAPNQCNGGGACLLGIGVMCAASADCGSGFCVDGVCCDTSCAGVCEACSMLKTGVLDGECAFITAGSDPDGECGNNESCDGAGMCGP